jgi:hypothetical protein
MKYQLAIRRNKILMDATIRTGLANVMLMK